MSRKDRDAGAWFSVLDTPFRDELELRLRTASALTLETVALLRHGVRPAGLPDSIRVMPHTVFEDADGDRLEVTDLGDGRERLTIAPDADAVRFGGSFQSVDVPRDQLLALLARLTDRFTADFRTRSLVTGGADAEPDTARSPAHHTPHSRTPRSFPVNSFQHDRRHDEQHDQSWLAQAHAVVASGWLAGGSMYALGAVTSEFPAIISSLMFLAGAVAVESGLRHYRTWRRITDELHMAGCTCPPGSGGVALRVRDRANR